MGTRPARRGLVAPPGARLLLHRGGQAPTAALCGGMKSSHFPGRGGAMIPRPQGSETCPGPLSY